MASEQAHNSDDYAAHKHNQQTDNRPDASLSGQQQYPDRAYPAELLARPSIAKSTNAPVRASIIQLMQQNVGNKQARLAVQRFSGPSLAERPGGAYTNFPMTEDEQVTRNADQAWRGVYDEYPDMRPKADEMDDDEYTRMLSKAQEDLDNPAF